ncbi:MAG TPA: DUF87 domain-containing protein [Euzebya sp.]|nr:DUF87 domain-containing protein [Euzebya sp.]
MSDLYVGQATQPASAAAGRVVLDPADLTTHGVIVGMTGSGKTGLGVIAIEEALLAGIPTLVIDPKGDMANLCLRFPDMTPADFRPWIDEGLAQRQGTNPDDLAAATAERWRSGLEGSGIPSDRIRAYADVPVTVYTPGSTSGVGLDLIGSLRGPVGTGTDGPVGAGTDWPGAAEPEAQDEVTDMVSGLLALVGIQSDPLTGREHILLANLLLHAWGQGLALDLPALIGQVQQPPMRKLGVMQLDTFFPAKDRTALAMRLNGLLASPTFAAWTQGVPLDIQRLLHTDDGAPRCAVVSLAHLDDSERQFTVTLLLSRMITWMRRQSGTSSLRALIYMDEVFGFVPPVAMPPAKQPILTILKQARAFGVGMVLSTQNPVDLDYKAISNAGTWMIGRLQTERDKDRLLEGMRSASGTVDIDAISARISGLDKRQFVLHSTAGDQPTVFSTRWAMSYLAGPMTEPQIARLMAEQKGIKAPIPTAPDTVPAPSPGLGPPSLQAPPLAVAPERAFEPGAGLSAQPPGGSTDLPTVSAVAGAPATSSLAEDETVVAPPVPDDISQRHLDPAATWAPAVGAVPGGPRLQPWVALRVHLTFDEARADLDHGEEFEAVLPVNPEPDDLTGLQVVDHDDRDLTGSAPAGAAYVLPGAKISTATWWASVQRAVRDELHASRSMTVLHNASLKLWSRPAETREAFEARCRVVADEREDAEVDKLRTGFESKTDRIRAAVARAQDRVAQLEADVSARRSNELVNIGSSILGGFLGGRRSGRGVAADLRRAAGNRGQTSRAAQRLETAQGQVGEAVDDLAALEAELAADLLDIDHRWLVAAGDVSEVHVGLEKDDVVVETPVMVWVPTAP